MNNVLKTTLYPMNIDRPGDLTIENHPNGGILITDAQGGRYRVNKEDLKVAVEAIYWADTANKRRPGFME